MQSRVYFINDQKVTKDIFIDKVTNGLIIDKVEQRDTSDVSIDTALQLILNNNNKNVFFEMGNIVAKTYIVEIKECPAIKSLLWSIKNSVYGSTLEPSMAKQNKEVSAMDNGFIQSCIENNDYGLANDFLQNIYKMSFPEAVAHVTKVLNKEVPIS